MFRYSCTTFLALILCYPSVSRAELVVNPYPVGGAPETVQVKSVDVTGAEEEVLLPEIEPEAGLSPVEALLEAPAGYWSVKAGQSLKSVLEGWSKRQGVRLVWDVEGHDFKTAWGLEISGAYEEAVRVLLDQYNEHSVRPVAKLYLPRQEQKKTLIVSLVH